MKEEIPEFLSSAATAFYEALSSECDAKDSNMSSAQLREVMQHLSAIVRKTHSKDVDDIWTTHETLSSLLTRLKEEKKSKPLNQVIDALLKVIGAGGASKKSRKRKQSETTSAPALPNTENSTDVASQPKKKKKRVRKE